MSNNAYYDYLPGYTSWLTWEFFVNHWLMQHMLGCLYCWSYRDNSVIDGLLCNFRTKKLQIYELSKILWNIRKLVMQEYRKQKVRLPELVIPRSTSWGKSVLIHFLPLKCNVIAFYYIWVRRYVFSTDFSNSEPSNLFFHSKFV